MNEALMLAFGMTVPFLCLGLLLWLARLEETLGEGLEGSPAKATREPAPAEAAAMVAGAPEKATASAAA